MFPVFFTPPDGGYPGPAWPTFSFSSGVGGPPPLLLVNDVVIIPWVQIKSRPAMRKLGGKEENIWTSDFLVVVEQILGSEEQ